MKSTGECYEWEVKMKHTLAEETNYGPCARKRSGGIDRLSSELTASLLAALNSCYERILNLLHVLFRHSLRCRVQLIMRNRTRSVN